MTRKVKTGRKKKPSENNSKLTKKDSLRSMLLSRKGSKKSFWPLRNEQEKVILKLESSSLLRKRKLETKVSRMH